MRYNGFFLRDDVGKEWFPEITAKAALKHPWNNYGYQNRLPKVKDMGWVKV